MAQSRSVFAFLALDSPLARTTLTVKDRVGLTGLLNIPLPFVASVRHERPMPSGDHAISFNVTAIAKLDPNTTGYEGLLLTVERIAGDDGPDLPLYANDRFEARWQIDNLTAGVKSVSQMSY